MKRRWVIQTPPPEEEVDTLARQLHCSRVVALLLLQRGVRTVDEARAFFKPALNMLHDPFLMKDMDRAVERLERAIGRKEGVMIYGDYDVDGTTAVALLYRYLKQKCEGAIYYIPDRDTEGCGISSRAIDYAAQAGISLMIVTDCGVKAVDEVRDARQRGIDMIICDHHTPGDVLPEAVAVLDPQRDDCGYPYRWLSACGVSFKLAQAYNESHNLPLGDLYNLLDLVCVSIASDIVPITGENRILAYFGLQQLNEAPSLGLKIILESSGVRVGRRLGINDIVFRVGPKINAAGRVESGNKSVELLIAEDENEARRVACDIDAFNDQRKQLDHSITEEALRYVRESCADRHPKVTVLYNPNWHKGVIGIVASRLTECYYRPTVILTQSNGVATGSARSVEGFDLYGAISRCSDLLENFGGHKYAVGLTLRLENIGAFRERFEQVASEMLDEQLLTPQLSIDAKIKLSEVTLDTYRMIQRFAPFGPGNGVPVFMTENVTNFMHSMQVGHRNEHLKLVVVDDTRACRDRTGIAFNMGEYFPRIEAGEFFDICYTLHENVFMGKVDIQMMVRDIHFKEEE